MPSYVDWTGDIYFNNRTVNSCGVAILINPRFNYTHVCTSQDSSGRVIAITKIDYHYLHLVNLYAPNSDTDRRPFFSSLESYLSPRYYNVIGGELHVLQPRTVFPLTFSFNRDLQIVSQNPTP